MSGRANIQGRPAAKTAALALMALVVVTGAAYAGYKRTAASADDKTVPTAVVTRADVQSSVPADGRVAVDEWSLSFGVAGRVASVDVSEGTTVTAGQLLASLDNTKAQAQVTQAQSGLAAAQSKLAGLRNQPKAEDVAAKQAVVDGAESALVRAREAYALLKAESLETTVSASELQAKAAAVESAESQVRIAEANLAAASVPATKGEIAAAEAAVTDASAGLRAAVAGLEDYLLRAPADGVVVSVSLTVGQALASGSGQSPAVVIADVTNQRIEGQLDEADASAAHAGMAVDIIVDSLGGRNVSGKIAQVAPVAKVDPNGLATFDIEVTLDETTDDLAAGMAVRMQVITDQAADVLTILTAAVRRIDGKPVVTIVDEDGNTSNRTVVLGKTDGKIVEVVSGLDEGQKVALGAVTEAKR